jgi:hypothetical protein
VHAREVFSNIVRQHPESFVLILVLQPLYVEDHDYIGKMQLQSRSSENDEEVIGIVVHDNNLAAPTRERGISEVSNLSSASESTGEVQILNYIDVHHVFERDLGLAKDNSVHKLPIALFALPARTRIPGVVSSYYDPPAGSYNSDRNDGTLDPYAIDTFRILFGIRGKKVVSPCTGRALAAITRGFGSDHDNALQQSDTLLSSSAWLRPFWCTDQEWQVLIDDGCAAQ